MALDISQGARFPIFFYGQRYMGALEAYVAAALVRLLGHSPSVVALAPLLFFALFVAEQYAVWRIWSGKRTANLAALITLIGSPFLALWSVASRGGYTVVLAWALPVLACYRRAVEPGAPPLSRSRLFGWGFLFAIGYFLNPLSIIIYATLAVDWTFARHGRELRESRARTLSRIPISGRWGGWIALGAVGAVIAAIGVCCHVERVGTSAGVEFVFLLNLIPGPLGKLLGALGLAAIALGVLVWTTSGRRIVVLLTSRPWFVVGMLSALSPFVLYNLLASMGMIPRESSLAMWIRAPWDLRSNLASGCKAALGLIGADPSIAVYSVYGEDMVFPLEPWRSIDRFLVSLSPWLVVLVVGLVIWRVQAERMEWARFVALDADGSLPPVLLMGLGVAVLACLFLLQATSANQTSMRYLLPLWVFLPGLAAESFARLTPTVGRAILAALFSAWTLSQACVWHEMARGSSSRELVTGLERMGARAIVAPSHVVLLTADLSAGKVGGMDFNSSWSRVRDRFRDRFETGKPFFCVIDRAHVWHPGDGLEPALGKLCADHPGKVRMRERILEFEIWEVDLSVDDLLRLQSGEGLPGGAEPVKLLNR